MTEIGSVYTGTGGRLAFNAIARQMLRKLVDGRIVFTPDHKTRR